MAWTINNGKLYFNTKIFDGNSTDNRTITGVGFQPDFSWIKCRNNGQNHNLFDAIRGATKVLESNGSNTESTDTTSLKSFTSDGYTLGTGVTVNGSSKTYASWNWPAAGTAPSNTYIVKVVSDTGNKYRFDDFGTSAVTLEISEGGTFTFDQADSSNNGHPLRFATQADGANSSQYTTGVTTNGTPGQAGAYTRITVAASAPTLFYYCTNHTGMGGQANTPTTNSFSNFSGSIQSNISPNATSGFSVVSYTGTGSQTTFGHGLGAAPSMLIHKKLTSSADAWSVFHQSVGVTKRLILSSTEAAYADASPQPDWNDVAPTSSVVTVGTSSRTNASGQSYICYVFSEKQGFSKFGSYTANNSSDGPFIYTGFKPAFFICKKSSGTESWYMNDNKRSAFNPTKAELYANESQAEGTGNARIDLLSNGVKMKTDNGGYNTGSETYIYMAFAENPFTSSAGTPVTAR